MIPRKFGCKCLIFCFYELEETETADLANLIESQQITPATVEEIPAEEDRDQLKARNSESQTEYTSAVDLVQNGRNVSVTAPDYETQQPIVSTGRSVKADQLTAPSTITPRTFKRKLDEARLPPAKRVGRPRKAKALDHYKYTGKPFVKKNKLEQVRGKYMIHI